MKLNIAGVLRHSSVNGEGLRYVLFMQGCPHKCRGCQNPETHDINGGTSETSENIVKDILNTKYLDGVTLSGGDPFFNIKATLTILRELKENNLNIWVYTGWRFEDIINNLPGENAAECLKYIDVLVDGKFKEDLMDGEHIYRGSSNQRLIDVQKSLKENKVISLYN